MTAARAKNAPATNGAGAKAFQAVADAFAGVRRVEPGRMFGSPGLKVGGKVFAMLVKERLVVKLPKARVDELVRDGFGEYFDPGHGRLMKEWLSAPAGGQADWVELARSALTYVGGD